MCEAFSRVYTEADVEQKFGISVSRLRTAQRFGLVESQTALIDRRYARVWSVFDVALVHLAMQIDHFLALPFPVCCQLIQRFSSDETRELRDILGGAVVNEKLGPCITIKNREFVCVHFKEPPRYIGTVRRDEANRYVFEAIEPSERPPVGDDEAISSCTIRCHHAMKEFVTRHATDLGQG